MPSLKQQVEKHQKLVATALEIRDNKLFDTDGVINQEVQKEFDSIMEDADALEDIISKATDIHTKLAEKSKFEYPEADVFSGEEYSPVGKSAGLPFSGENKIPTKIGNTETASEESVRKGYAAWLRYGDRAFAYDTTKDFRNVVAKSASTSVDKEGYQMDVDAAGGFMVMPREVYAGIVENIKEQFKIRSLVREIPLGVGQSLTYRTVADVDEQDDIDMVGEITKVSTYSEAPFDEGKLTPKMSRKQVKISRDMMRAPGFDIEAFAESRLAYKFGRTWENMFIYGDGAARPLGVLVPSARGIPTSRDVTLDMSNYFTSPANNTPLNPKSNNNVNSLGDFVYDVIDNLKEYYQNRATWVLHRKAVTIFRKLQDANGDYVWKPGLEAGSPATIGGIPYITSEFMPNPVSRTGINMKTMWNLGGTVQTSQYLAVLMDLDEYWVASSVDFEMQRLEELHAETNQIGIIGKEYHDGAPVKAEAAVRIRLVA